MDGDRLVHLDGCVGMMVRIDGDYDARIASAVSGFSHNECRIGYGGTDQFGCLPDGIDRQGFDGTAGNGPLHPLIRGVEREDGSAECVGFIDVHSDCVVVKRQTLHGDAAGDDDACVAFARFVQCTHDEQAGVRIGRSNDAGHAIRGAKHARATHGGPSELLIRGVVGEDAGRDSGRVAGAQADGVAL